MAKKIINPGTDVYRATCSECGAVFSYQRDDVQRNYVRGGEWVTCPQCGHAHMHFGASGTVWPDGRSRRCRLDWRGHDRGGYQPSGPLPKGSCFN